MKSVREVFRKDLANDKDYQYKLKNNPPISRFSGSFWDRFVVTPNDIVNNKHISYQNNLLGLHKINKLNNGLNFNR